MAFPIAAILGIGKTVIDRVIPDKNARAAAHEELERMEQAGELSLLQGQLAINQQEAAHKSLFVAGWRPGVGWVCVLAMLNNFIVAPYAVAFGVDLPSLDLNEMMPVLLGLLGLGGMRSYEKVRGAAREK